MLVGLLSLPRLSAQQISCPDRDLAETMLESISADVRKHYYDPTFHGVDWEAKVGETKKAVDTSPSLNMALLHIAGALDALRDSHTFLLPPQHVYRHDYGWQYQVFGNRCLVTRVRPGSDAESKGVKPGDEVLAINGLTPTRDSLWKIQYIFGVLEPQPGQRLELQAANGTQRQVDILAKIQAGKKVTDLTASGTTDIWSVIGKEEEEAHRLRSRDAEFGEDLMVVKLPGFFFDEDEVGRIFNRARKYKALIVDLRGNPGGSEDTLKYFVGGVFDKEIKIAERIGRKESKPLVAKPMHNVFGGKLVVLVDSRSASASELFARVVQIEKRGIVMGDHTSGSVMESKRYSYQMGVQTVIFYGASITEADLIMSDGKSLEHIGVEPDQGVIPTPSDLANGHDPALAYAAGALGVKLTSEEAGKLFPYEWPPE